MPEKLNPKQIEIFKSMTPEKKLQVALDLYWTARSLKAAGLRHQHPDWSEEQIDKKVRDIFFRATT